MLDGKYNVKVIDAGLGASKNGSMQPWVKFQNEAKETITWYGNLNGSTPEKQEKAQEITIKALVSAGFTGDDFSDLDKPFETVFTVQPVNITVGTEEYNGKKTTKVKFVNSQSAPKKFMGQAPKMAALFAKQRKALGITAKPSTEDAPF